MAVDTGIYDHDGLVVLDMFRGMVSAANASLAQTQLGTPAEFGLWHGTPIDDCCNRLLLWTAEWTPTDLNDFPNPANGFARCHSIDLPPRVTLSLRRPCGPVPDQYGNVPLASEQAVAEHMILDARALMCGVQSTWPGLLEANYPGRKLAFGAMIPTPNTTECMGWDWPINIEIPACKTCVS